jgi:cell wall assembly regulator SMI1
MTAADLQRLETALGRPLSPPVRESFLGFPPGLRLPDDERDPDDMDFELTDDVEALIAMNTDGPGRVWLPGAGPNFFALGCGGCGETWWVDLDDPTGAVYFADAGTDAEYSDRVADSLAEFAQRTLDAEPDEEPD